MNCLVRVVEKNLLRASSEGCPMRRTQQRDTSLEGRPPWRAESKEVEAAIEAKYVDAKRSGMTK